MCVVLTNAHQFALEHVRVHADLLHGEQVAEVVRREAKDVLDRVAFTGHHVHQQPSAGGDAVVGDREERAVVQRTRGDRRYVRTVRSVVRVGHADVHHVVSRCNERDRTRVRTVRRHVLGEHRVHHADVVQTMNAASSLFAERGKESELVVMLMRLVVAEWSSANLI